MFLYRLLLTLLAPVAALIALRQVLRGKESVSDIKERFGAGLASAPMLPGSTLWIHGASNGELTAGRALIEDALARDGMRQIIVTVNSVTARQLVQNWGLDRVTVRLAPLDFKRTVHHFIACTQPDALITIENEIWPNRFTHCAAHDIPVIVVGARMSHKTLEDWQKYTPVLKDMTRLTLDAITALAPQDTASKDRIVALGLDPERLLPMFNLKSGVDATMDVPADAARLRASFQKGKTILAASTHDGEDEIVLKSFASLRKSHPELKLILAPRHPARADKIQAYALSLGLDVSRRSTNDAPEYASVYLADTLGEMALWYALAGFTFVGGSLVDNGGHTPFEPAQFGSVVLHGPFVSNHAPAFEALAQAGGALKVKNATDLEASLDALLLAPTEAAQLAQSGTQALEKLRTSKTASAAFWSALDDAIKVRKKTPSQKRSRL
ncbi:glycosyltransferase N-terminal domain-containing protein [Pacificibacter sp. AS14]|uniref:3-deoxy-D-manno-octulosonic acid transferase n=1 Tax=Pacificibacter sp. AS14 TaxID=3135785 RepID=UPI003174B08B